MNGAAINLHIEELVLHGFPADQRKLIAAAMQKELVRLLSEQPAKARQDISLDRVRGGTLRIAANQKPEATGVHIARNVFRAVRQQSRSSAAAERPLAGGPSR